MNVTRETQAAQILHHLKSGKPITALEALKRFGCLRLAPRILEAREAGYRINSHWIKANGKRFVSYRMVA